MEYLEKEIIDIVEQYIYCGKYVDGVKFLVWLGYAVKFSHNACKEIRSATS